MPGIADLIFGLMGQKDPRQQIMASIAGGGQPPAAQPGTGPGAEPGPKPQPEAYNSPPDMMAMYTELMDRQRRSDMINRGTGLLFSSFAQPQNRAAIMQAATSGGGGGADFDPLEAMKLAEQIRTGRVAESRQEQLRGNIPKIAAQLGISLEQAQILFESGELDEFIKEGAKPNNITFENADGTHSIIDAKTGKVTGTYGPKKEVERKTQVVNNPDGSSNLIDSQTGDVIRQVVAPGNKPTDDMVEWMQINKDREAKGEDPIPLDQWLLEQKKAGAQQTTVSIGGEKKFAEKSAEAKVKDLYESQDKARAVVQTNTATRSALDLLNRGTFAGDITSPAWLQGVKLMSSYLGVGPENAEKISNTETLQSELRKVVLPEVKQLGTGNSISNADVKFTEESVGNITQNPNSIKNIILIREKGQINELLKYNDMIDNEIKKRTARDPNFDPSDMPDKVPIPKASPDLQAMIMVRNDIPKAALDDLVADPTPEKIKAFDEHYGEGSYIARILLGNY